MKNTLVVLILPGLIFGGNQIWREQNHEINRNPRSIAKSNSRKIIAFSFIAKISSREI